MTDEPPQKRGPVFGDPGGQLIKVGVKAAILAVCLGTIFAGGHPPVVAQQLQQIPMSAEDATQDANIQAINEHLRSTDKNVSEVQAAQNLNGLAVAEMQGEERVFAGVLAALTTVSIFIQIRVKKATP